MLSYDVICDGDVTFTVQISKESIRVLRNGNLIMRLEENEFYDFYSAGHGHPLLIMLDDITFVYIGKWISSFTVTNDADHVAYEGHYPHVCVRSAHHNEVVATYYPNTRLVMRNDGSLHELEETQLYPMPLVTRLSTWGVCREWMTKDPHSIMARDLRTRILDLDDGNEYQLNWHIAALDGKGEDGTYADFAVTGVHQEGSRIMQFMGWLRENRDKFALW